MAMTSDYQRVKECTARAPRGEGEGEYFPEVFRDVSRVSQNYQQPNDYRILDVPEANFKRSADVKVPSKRAR